MATVHFTQNLRRHVDCPTAMVDASSVNAALEGIFQQHPKLRSYIVDERGSLRKHMTVFIDGELIRDRRELSDPVGPESEIYVMQALSGG